MHAEVFVQEDREKREREAEPEDRHELGEPQRGEVAAPVHSTRVDRRRRLARVGRQRYEPRISTIRSDVIGRRSTTASGLRLRSASSTAFEMAAGAGIVPLSPAPLNPSGFASVGVAMCTRSGVMTSPVLTIV